MKLDGIKQEPKERVQRYFGRLNRLFQKGRIPDAEQRRRFLARLRPEIRKLCVVGIFTDIEEMVGAATELERVLSELGETPFEPLKEEQEEGVTETIMQKQVAVLNNALVSFFKRNVPKPVTSSSSTMFGGCQICKGGDHIATTCPRLNEPRPKCARCGMPHRTENCGMKCSFCSGLGHSEDRCWKKPKDGKVHPRSTNFLEVLLNDEGATTIIKDKIPEQQPVKEFAEATEVSENDETQVVSKELLIGRFKLAKKQASAAELEEEAKDKVQDVIPEQQLVAKLAEATDGIDATHGIDVMMEDVLKMTGITIGQELGPELGATNKELTDSAEDRISTLLVEMTAVIENDTNIVSKEPPVDRLEMSEEQTFAELREEAEDEAANVIPEQEPVAAELAEERTDRIDVLIEDELQARITQDEEFRAELNDTNKELVHSAQDGTSADFVEATSGMENHTQVVSKEPPVDTRLKLPEEQASIEVKAEDFTPEEQPVANLRATTEGNYVTTINELEFGMTHDEKPIAEFSDTNKEFIDAVEDKIYAELVETMEGIENDTWMVWEESSINRLGLPEEQNSTMLEEETQEDYKAEETPIVVLLAEAVDGGIEVANEDELEEAGITHDAKESRAKLIDTIEELVDSAHDKIGAELVETTGGMMGCKKALVAYESDVAKASEYLWKKGLASVEKGKQAISEAVNCAKVHVLLQVHQIDSDDFPNGCGNYRPFSCSRIYII
jgi:hypothetical protein